MTTKSKPLFSLGSYLLHSGSESTWKIECDALGEEDWCTIAFLLAERLPPFGAVYGIPRGGIALANSLLRYVKWDAKDKLPVLVVDDVLTSGNSLIEWKNNCQQPCIGAVVFARDVSKVPSWVTPLFTMTPERKK